MKTVKVNLKERSYDIIIAKNAILKLNLFLEKLQLGNAALIVTNQYLKDKFGTKLSKELTNAGILFKFFILPPLEKAKSFKYLIKLLNETARYGADKKLFFIAFGGGVVGDLTGFAASIYKRGIPYIQIPTTLLAQVDSSIGGKTAIDLAFAKNLIGSFYQPRLVISDLNFLNTLPLKEIKAGLSEIIKYAIIKDKNLFNELENKYKLIFSLNPDFLEYIISSSSRIKAKIVSQDERETKQERLILNFGHTIAHAIEAAYGYRYSHGEAVALGIIYETIISQMFGLINKEERERIEKLILNCNIAPRIQNLNIEKILQAQKFDKKFIARINRFALVSAIGEAKIYEDIPASLIKQALKTKI